MKPNASTQTRRFAGVTLGLLLCGATANPASAAGYQVSLNVAPQAAGGGIANCSYNYGGGTGGSCNLQQNGTGSVTPVGGNGLATSAAVNGTVYGASTASFLVDPSIYGTASASADLATGSLHLYEHDTGKSQYYDGFAAASANASLSDTLFYSVAGASADTITPIDLTFTVEGLIQITGTDTFDNQSHGEVSGAFTFGSGDARFDLQNNVTTGFATMAGLDTYPSAYPGTWTTNADHTVNTFTAVYNVTGAAGELPIGATASLFCGNGMLCDFGHTFQIGLTGPADFSYTSASGVFLTGTGGVPEPATWAMMLLGFGGLGAAMRTRRQKARLAG
jgi:hypothetical protein